MQETDSKGAGNINRDRAKQRLGVAGGFGVYQKEFILDNKLSAGAKVLFLVMWSLPCDFFLSERTLTKYLNNKSWNVGKSNIHRQFLELEEKGYISKVKLGYFRDNGVTSPLYQYTLHEVSVYLASCLEEQLENNIANSTEYDIDF